MQPMRQWSDYDLTFHRSYQLPRLRLISGGNMTRTMGDSTLAKNIPADLVQVAAGYWNGAYEWQPG